ncbi:MAG: 5-formyltetrahydrofolate cyclo-ligase [Ignavibacteria bacterium]|nr:5-formyltetrahydrofolate cyclo-ligase [Ignavibacteria bacterium]
MSNLKSTLRKTLLSLRDALPVDVRSAQSQRIAESLLALPEFVAASIIHSYLSFGSEVDTEFIRIVAFRQGKQVSVPITDKSNPTLLHSFIEDTEEFTFGDWNILVPKEPIIESNFRTSEHDIILVPLVGFDRNKHRLGYGKGYYDRFLSKQDAIKIGLAFSCQETELIPTEPHDQALTMIITEREIIR